MKRNFAIILTIIIFLLGVGIFLYPFVSNYMNEKHSSKVIADYETNIDEMEETEIEEALQKARDYNKDLFEHMIVLTDPFDPDAFPITDEQYESVLNISDIMAYVEIPSIDVSLPVYHGTSEDVLAKGVGHLENTSMPVGGADTHTVLSAHCGLPGARLFTDLDMVKEGDIFKIHVLNDTLAYEVFKIEVVEPEDSSTLYVERGKDLATLVTCTPYGENTHRLLVHGTRISLEEEKQEGNHKSKQPSWKKYTMVVFFLFTFVFLLTLTVAVKVSRKRKEEYEKEDQ